MQHATLYAVILTIIFLVIPAAYGMIMLFLYDTIQERKRRKHQKLMEQKRQRRVRRFHALGLNR